MATPNKGTYEGHETKMNESNEYEMPNNRRQTVVAKDRKKGRGVKAPHLTKTDKTTGKGD